MILLLLKLLIAHTLGDFFLQPGKWVKDKFLKKHRSKYLYYHVLIHFVLLLIILNFNWLYWPGVLVIVISHLFIDAAKLNLNGKGNAALLFIGDQVAHLIILLGVAYFYNSSVEDFNLFYSVKNLSLILALLSLTSASAITIQVIMNQWKLEEDNAQNSLPKAGLYIGILERLLVFCFIVINQWLAVGLLITAKSIFRFSDISKARNRKLTEYILIGTLLSFGFAITIGLIYQKLQTI